MVSVSITHLILTGQDKANLSTGVSWYASGGVADYWKQLFTVCGQILDQGQIDPQTLSFI